MRNNTAAPHIQKNYAYWENECNIEVMTMDIDRLEKKLDTMRAELANRIQMREELHQDVIKSSQDAPPGE